ncbi:hypothetical protein IKW72_07940 [bacterium]|nr:hypothetical protein [bacterium]
MLPTHVRKRDGRLVTFDIGKLKRSIEAALLAAEVPGSEYAEDAAYAIAMHLGKTFPQQPPQTSDVAVTVARALEKSYGPRASAVYLDYRVARDEQRAKCTVIKPRQISLFDADTTVSVMTGGEQNARPWNRAFIVRALEQEAHLKHSAAETIAQEVEERILSSGLSVVTTTLIRAVVDSELLAKGYANSLRQRSSVTVPYEALQRGLNEPEELNQQLGRRVSAPYSLSHIYSEDVAMAHRQGLIGIGGLDHPYSRFFERLEMDPNISASQFRRQFLTELKKLDAKLCSTLVCVFREDFLKRLPRERITEIRDAAAAFGGRVCLSFPVGALEDLFDLLKDSESSPNLTWQFLGDAGDIEKLSRLFLDFSIRGHNVLWNKVEQTPVSQLVAVNLPRIVYKNKNSSLEELLMGLRPSLEAAVHACRQYRLFAQANGQLRMSDTPGCEILGVREAVSTFCGHDDPEEQYRTAETILGASREILHKLSEAYYFDIQLVNGCGRDFGSRFAMIDERLFPEIFGFLPFRDSDADALRHSIPPYRMLESFTGDRQDEILRWAQILNANCDSGCFPISTADQDLLSSLFNQGFGVLLTGQRPQDQFGERYLESRGQTSLF